MKNIIDITIPLGPDTPLYPGDPQPELELLNCISEGDALTASKLHLASHVGTHVDLPAHFVENGATLGDYTVDRFVGPGWVLDLSDVSKSICVDRLAKEKIPEQRHLILRTRNSRLLQESNFVDDYVYLEEDAASWLLETNPLSIGIDYYSLDPVDSVAFKAHRRCAEVGIPVFVCLDLRKLGAGACWFAGLPVSFPALEGAPVRAIVWYD